MSFNVSLVGKDAAEAKAKLAECSDLPEEARQLADAAVDALPASGVEGCGAVAVSLYGHFAAEGAGDASNFNLSVQHVNGGGLKAA
jgi:hypothetical protein